MCERHPWWVLRHLPRIWHLHKERHSGCPSEGWGERGYRWQEMWGQSFEEQGTYQKKDPYQVRRPCYVIFTLYVSHSRWSSQAAIYIYVYLFHLSYQINYCEISFQATMISVAKLEKAIHSKFVVHHLEVLDTSNGCGESYSILLVSDVSSPLLFPPSSSWWSPLAGFWG